jgi:hypothetical protein
LAAWSHGRTPIADLSDESAATASRPSGGLV